MNELVGRVSTNPCNEHLDEEDGPLVFAHACKMGLEGIVSKRKDSPYRSGRSPHWIKSKNPTANAVETAIMPIYAILVVLVEGVHDRPPLQCQDRDRSGYL